MAKNDNLTDFVTDLANAIRWKCNKSSAVKINPQSFADEIKNLPYLKDISGTFPTLTATVNTYGTAASVTIPGNFPWIGVAGGEYLSIVVLKFETTIGAHEDDGRNVHIFYGNGGHTINEYYAVPDGDATYYSWGVLVGGGDGESIIIETQGSADSTVSVKCTPYLLMCGQSVFSARTAKGGE